MPLNLERDAELNIYKINNRPLDLTSFARAVAACIAELETRIAALEQPEAIEPERAEDPIVIQDEASALDIAPPGYKRKKKNKSKELS